MNLLRFQLRLEAYNATNKTNLLVASGGTVDEPVRLLAGPRKGMKTDGSLCPSASPSLEKHIRRG